MIGEDSGYSSINLIRNTAASQCGGCPCGGDGAPKSVKLGKQSLIFPVKSRIVYQFKIGSRLIRISFPVAIVIAINKWKSLIDLKTKIADRFSCENRIPIFRSVNIIVSQTGFLSRSISKDKSRIGFDLKNGDRFRNKNRSLIFPEKCLWFENRIPIFILCSGENLVIGDDHPMVAGSLQGTKPEIIVGGGDYHRQKNPYGNSGTSEYATSPVVPLFPWPPDSRGHNSEKCGTEPE